MTAQIIQAFPARRIRPIASDRADRLADLVIRWPDAPKSVFGAAIDVLEASADPDRRWQAQQIRTAQQQARAEDKGPVDHGAPEGGIAETLGGLVIGLAVVLPPMLVVSAYLATRALYGAGVL